MSTDARSGVLGVIIGAAAIVVAYWYLSQTKGGLVPTGALSLAGVGAGAYAGQGYGGCGCGCPGTNSTTIGPGGTSVGQAGTTNTPTPPGNAVL